MPRLSPALFLLALLLLSDGKKLAAGEEGICTESLGLCGQDCDERCRVKHGGENPQGSCDHTFNVPQCNCLYSCNSTAPPKQPGRNCLGAVGLCSSQCWDDCCDAKCSSKYNQGRGYCDVYFGTAVCQCSYVC